MSNKEQDRKRLKEHLNRGTTEPFILRQEECDYCACYLLLYGLGGQLTMMWRFFCCKLAELSVFGVVKSFFYRRAGVKVGHGVVIAPGVVLDYLSCDLITLEDGCVIGMGAMILTHEYTPSESRVGRVRIGRNAVIGARAVIRSGVTVGEGATVGMMSLVIKDILPGVTVGGVPAKELRKHVAG